MAYTHEHEEKSGGTTLLRWIGRLVIIAVILAAVSLLTPGFSIGGLWSYLIAAVVISVLDYLVERLFKMQASPFGNGIKGFILSVVILYVAQFLVPNMTVSLWGAVIGAFLIGLLDAVFPSRVF